MNSEQVWITADTHFGHESIIKHCNRPFINANEMDEYIIEKWNSMVNKHDHVYIVGDFAFNNHMKYINALKGFKHLIVGNHDSMNKECLNRFISVSEQKNIRYKNYFFILNHFPLRTWSDAYRGAIHLFGHCHGRIDTYNLSFDIGMDTNNYKPYNMEEIIKKIKDREETMKKAHRIIEQNGKKQYFQDDIQYLQFLLKKEKEN